MKRKKKKKKKKRKRKKRRMQRTFFWTRKIERKKTVTKKMTAIQERVYKGRKHAVGEHSFVVLIPFSSLFSFHSLSLHFLSFLFTRIHLPLNIFSYRINET